MSKVRAATVKTTDVRPKRPKVDRGEEFETLVRQLFKPAVDTWCKDNLDEMPDKEVRGNAVDNLTASFTSSFETLVDAATDSYLSTLEAGDEAVECPKCKEVFDIPEDFDPEDEDAEIECPKCEHVFHPDEDDDDDEPDPDDGEREPRRRSG